MSSLKILSNYATHFEYILSTDIYEPNKVAEIDVTMIKVAYQNFCIVQLQEFSVICSVLCATIIYYLKLLLYYVDFVSYCHILLYHRTNEDVQMQSISS